MQLGRVVGTVVATIRTDGLDGVKFLIVQPLDKHRRDRGSPVVAADAVAMAGPGELVYYVASREAAEALEERFVPGLVLRAVHDHAYVGCAVGTGDEALFERHLRLQLRRREQGQEAIRSVDVVAAAGRDGQEFVGSGQGLPPVGSLRNRN